MNIKEIEEKTGLERATIRYYESAGLLRPQRRENGYRDYSEADLTILQRIRLLRHLGVSLEEIGRLQQGEIQLSHTMEQRLQSLMQEKEQAESCSAVCRKLRDDGVTWQTLDAERYSPAILQEAQKRIHIPPDRIAGHPWRRVLSRVLDVLLCAPLPLAAFMGMLNAAVQSTWPDSANVLLFLACAALVFGTAVIEIFGEALFLHLTGTTLGKWLMGISLEDRNGCLPSFSEARHRTRRVYFPAFDAWVEQLRTHDFFLFMDWLDKCEQGQDLPWEEYQWLSVVYHPLPRWKQILYSAVLCAVVVGLIWLCKAILGI